MCIRDSSYIDSNINVHSLLRRAARLKYSAFHVDVRRGSMRMRFFHVFMAVQNAFFFPFLILWEFSLKVPLRILQIPNMTSQFSYLFVQHRDPLRKVSTRTSRSRTSVSGLPFAHFIHNVVYCLFGTTDGCFLARDLGSDCWEYFGDFVSLNV